jgi:uncharacterized protein
MQSNSRLAVPLFLVLGFALSWYPWALHALGYSGNPNPNPLGVLVAALIAAAVTGGWREAVAILKAMVRVRASATVWLATFAIPVGALAVGAGSAALFGITMRPAAISGSELLDRFLIVFLFVALGEEPGWRGFLQPMLQRRLGVLGATACVAVVWAVWHAPLLGTEFAWEIVPAFLLSVFAGAFVLAWLFNASGGSVLLPMLMHATVNTLGAGLVFRWVAEDQLALFWYIYAAVWVVIAVALTVWTRGTLGSSVALPVTPSQGESAAPITR